LRLSVLDQSPVPAGQTGADALRNTLDLARLADDLGFHRYWVAEHHGGGMVAGPSPEVLIGPIAAATTNLRVGSGGVMLPHYSPLKVAENFGVLSGLFPGRIDLGIGRASGTDPITAFALQRDRRERAPDDFPQQLAELLAYLNDSFPADHPFGRIELPGEPSERPQPWLLGSSPQSAIWAADLGLPYAFADFINREGASIAQSYVERFQPSDRTPAAEIAVGAWVLAADTEEEAQRLASSGRLAFRQLRRGTPGPIPRVADAIRALEREGRDPLAPSKGRREIVGTPEQVRDGVRALADEYGASEVIVVTITHDHAARRRSYELLADAFALPAGDAARAA
ncbi:MAG: LLM class flavin-dependent oxidoreductase, partial [Solirubrobacteraceae bacterium]|nr:LLM class flavin-dependent oxidoreductase [Solirubrobacteraceae bacterium]